MAFIIGKDHSGQHSNKVKRKTGAGDGLARGKREQMLAHKFGTLFQICCRSPVPINAC